jgi:hypothetical protein
MRVCLRRCRHLYIFIVGKAGWKAKLSLRLKSSREVKRDDAAVKMAVVRSINTGKARFLPFFSLWVCLWGLEYNRCCVFHSLYARFACVSGPPGLSPRWQCVLLGGYVVCLVSRYGLGVVMCTAVLRLRLLKNPTFQSLSNARVT